MKRMRPPKTSRAYRQCWRIVDGAVRDALEQHPEYLTDAGGRSARASITKRVTGAIVGYAEQSARGRSGARPAVERELRPYFLGSWRKAVKAVRQWWAGELPPAQTSRREAA